MRRRCSFGQSLDDGPESSSDGIGDKGELGAAWAWERCGGVRDGVGWGAIEGKSIGRQRI